MKRIPVVILGIGLVVLVGLLFYVSRDVETTATADPVRATVSRPLRPAPVPVPSSKPVQRNRIVAIPLRPVAVASTASVDRVYSSTGRASLKDGETLVTGGWATEPGKRTWVLVTPSVVSTNGEKLVEFRGKFVNVPDELLTDPFWESLKAGATTNNEAGAMAPEYVGALMDSWRDREDVHVLSCPQVVTLDGGEATLMVGSFLASDENTGKTDCRQGIKLQVRPVIGADGMLTLDLSAEVRP